MDVLPLVAGLFCAAVLLFAYFAPAAWAVGDAQQRGQTGAVVAALFYLFGPLSALIWLIIRPRAKVVDRQPDEYDNADDALAAATRLDQLGEWDAAIRILESAARRWPEHKEYISNSLRMIKEKQSLNGGF